MNYTYITKQEQLLELKDWLQGRRYCAIDTETGPKPQYIKAWRKNNKLGLDPNHSQIYLIQIGDRNKQFIIDTRAKLDLTIVSNLLTDETIAKLGVNLRFDCKFLMRHFGVVPVQLFDVMLVEQLLRPGIFLVTESESSALAIRKYTSMASLVRRYLDIEIDKDKTLRTTLWMVPMGQFTERQLEYAANDCIYPDLIVDHQKPLIADRNISRVINLENRLIPVMADMELTGIPFNSVYWIKLMQQATTEMHALEKVLDTYFSNKIMVQDDMFGENVTHRQYDYSSNPQMAQALHSYGIKGFIGPSGEALSTASDRIKLMKIEGHIEEKLADTILTYRSTKKRKESYGDNLLSAINNITKRIHPDFTQCCLVTGRLSCSPGMQTIPKSALYRSAFYSPENYTLIVLDASQVEPRISADLTNDLPAIEVFQAGLDIYQKDGELMYQRPIIRGTEEGEMLRTRAKVSWLGLTYGQGKRKFNNYCRVFLNEDIPRSETDELWDKFFSIHHQMKKVMDSWSNAVNPLESNDFFFDEVADASIKPEVLRENLTPIYMDRFNGREEQVNAVLAQLVANKARVTYSNTPLGRKRFYRADFIGHWTAARNYPIQATAADIQKSTMLGFQEFHWEKKYDAHIINVVHDEIITLVREDQAEELCEKQIKLGAEIGQKFLTKVPMVLDGGVTPIWKKF